MSNSTIDILWVVIAAALVFLMQPGFMCLESGLTRSKNSINVAVKNLADFVFSVLTFWMIGYGIMFGISYSGIAGTDGFLLEMGENGKLSAFFLFQAMFCGTATTIFSGAVAERMKFSAYLLVVFIMSIFIYPVFGHWAWNGLYEGVATGWLGAKGFVDFAGSTVVHSVGGWVALAVLLVIGPRQGRFDSQHSAFGFNGSNLPQSVLGTCLLWFGWIGFNGGSTLIMNENVPQIIVYTILAASAGAFSNLMIGYSVFRVPRVTFLINGSLGGLVAITANCHVVTGTAAILIGLAAGIITFFSEIVLNHFKVDDAVGAVPVHLASGIWGTIAVALFGDPEKLGTGLSMMQQLFVQIEGIVAAFVVAFVLPYYLIKQINKFFPLRVSEEAEHTGLNFSEHGATTELIELFQAMDKQVMSSDLSMRMPVEPFTEVGLIAERHNQVMDSLENALSQTEAVVSTAKDAIVTCLKGSLEIININPSGKLMFGLSSEQNITGIKLTDLLADSSQHEKRQLFQGNPVEVVGKTRCGSRFPMEALVTEAGMGNPSYYIGTFRDITEVKNREDILKESEMRYRELFENTGTPTIIFNLNNMIEMANHEFAKLSGYEKEKIDNKMVFTSFLPKDQLERILYYRKERMKGNRDIPRSYETKLLRNDGTVLPVIINVSIIEETMKTIVSCLDLSELKQVQNSLTKQRAYFLQLFEGSSQAIVALDENRNITSINNGFEELFGYSEEEVKGRSNRDVVVPEDLKEEVEAISKSVLTGNMIKKETYRLHKNGRRIPVSVLGFPIKVAGRLEGIFYIYEDISERKAFEQQLYKQAFYDGLTHIPNRILFMERLGRALERKKRQDNFTFAVLLIDLDRFKWVNDSLGHIAGDGLLLEIAQRFSASVRACDTVARLGGDEFAVLIEDFEKNSKVIEIANRIQEEAQRPVKMEKTEVRVSASVGIVLNTAEYDQTEAILRDADIAMYRAKELGKARYQVFNRRLHLLASEALELEQNLREVIETEKLILHYQPVYSTDDENITGFEALVRWPQEGGTLISPEKFIPIAEETGLIIPLGEWVLRTACRQLKNWHQTIPEGENLKVNVNISAKQFLQNNLVSTIDKILKETDLDAKYLKIELTESAIMEGGRNAVEKLNRLKKIGVKLAIDDFGTGYSSLSTLQQFPIDDLKIDRSFITDVEQKSENREIVKTIVTLAKNLDLEIVAEGVENKEQLSVLKKMECDNIQGFYFSKPLSVEQITEMVQTQKCNVVS